MSNRIVLLLAGLAGLACAQQPVAPAGGDAGPPRGEDVNGYNIVNSFETGYRFHSVQGNEGKYRSDVNYGNGIRLLSSSLGIHSKDGMGHYFDELLLNTQGLGNDPYQFSSFRIQKNRLYRYDLLWRENEYFNPALTISAGQHFLNTTRRMQDHSIILLPESKLRIYLGYSQNAQNGPGLSTVQLFDSRDDEYPVFADIRRRERQYRAGADLFAMGMKIGFLHTWEYFRDDTTDRLGFLAQGNNAADPTTLSSFYRAQPAHGSAPTWLVNVLSDRRRQFTVQGRFAYSGGRRDFIFDETGLGTNRVGEIRNRQILVFGNARRPVTAANLTLTLAPSETFTVVNHTAFHHTRMDGDGTYQELNNSTLGLNLIQFQFLGIRAFANQTDATVRVRKNFSLYGGYHFSDRRIRSIEQSAFFGRAEREEAQQTNRLHSGLAGVRIRPVKPLLIAVDAEIGRADRPIFPISERNYHILGARIQYRTRTAQFGVSSKANYNTNSVSLFAHSSRSRNYTADASWTPNGWVGFDAAYSKIHLDTLSGIAYFLQGSLTNGTSQYVSSIHSGTLGVRLAAGRRAEFYAGYSRVQDTAGDQRIGRVIPYQPLSATDVRNGLFWQAFPLTFESPSARVSVRLHEKVRWNLGYQYYRYDEEQRYGQNYRAHTGFSSVTWTF